MTKDVADLVGEYADAVENHSLLYDKYALPKAWGNSDKINDAGRWSVLRIVSQGSDLLKSDSINIRRLSQGRNIEDEAKRQRLVGQSKIAERMASIGKQDVQMARYITAKTTGLLRDLEKTWGTNCAVFEATLGGRLMVNMAGGVVQNAGICLDRCFGMPYIPGSAVKGVSRSQALWEIHEAPDSEKADLLRKAMILFGYGKQDVGRDGDFAWAAGTKLVDPVTHDLGAMEFKGCACFVPAYPKTAPTLVVDMVNPHYKDYYSGRAKQALDSESPIPNYFPAVEAGSSFGFAVLVQRVPDGMGLSAAALLDAAKGWVERAITEKGIGAKTAAGYGWFRLGEPPKRQAHGESSAATVPSDSPAEALINKFVVLSNTGNFPAVLPTMVTLSDADLKTVFEALVP